MKEFGGAPGGFGGVTGNLAAVRDREEDLPDLDMTEKPTGNLECEVQELYDEWMPETDEGKLYKNQLGKLIGTQDPLNEKKKKKKKKRNCFSHDNYKTFAGKSKCVQSTKGFSKKRANAYVASTLRKQGEIK